MHQPATIKLVAWASSALLALGVASCSSDDGGDPLSTLTDPPTTAPSATTATTSTTTTAVTTTTPADTTTAPPTAAPAPETETETVVTLSNSSAPVPPEVFEAVRVTSEREVALLYEPVAPDLDSRIGEVAEAGSRYEAAMRSRLTELQSKSVKFSRSEPSSNQLIVERGSYDGGADATIQFCEISNDRIVSAADPSVVVDDYWDGRLHVVRITVLMRRADDGEWRRSTVVGNVETFEGVETCPPES